MGNIKLYFYGLGAKALIYLGIIITAIGILTWMFLGWDSTALIVSIIMVIVGIAITIYGKAKRFNYQRQSGNIIHRGDW